VTNQDDRFIDRLELLLDQVPPGLIVRMISIGHLRSNDAVAGAELPAR
jgi:hypothetical protein